MARSITVVWQKHTHTHNFIYAFVFKVPIQSEITEIEMILTMGELWRDEYEAGSPLIRNEHREPNELQKQGKFQ